MRAIVQDRYGPEEVLHLADLPDPVIGDDEVLVRVAAAGVDRGVWHIMTGTPYLARLAFGLSRPKNPVRGMDVAGTVEAAGAAVTRFRRGDQVFGVCGGSFAELAVSREKHLAHKPAEVTFAQAAAAPTSGTTALQALRGRVQPGQRVLVLGAGGGVGHFAVQVAKSLGTHVTAATSSPEFAASLGADRVIDYRDEPLTGEFDLILDVGGRRPIPVLRALLAPKGAVVFVGGEGGGRLSGGMGRQLVFAPFSDQKFVTMLATITTADLEELATMMAAGTLVPSVERAYPLANAADAVRQMSHGSVRGKLVLVP
jgi:NADPH:quinone reductase-like Zn-dependent oxidoreductase